MTREPLPNTNLRFDNCRDEFEDQGQPGQRILPKNNGGKECKECKNNIFTPLVPPLLRVELHIKV